MILQKIPEIRRNGLPVLSHDTCALNLISSTYEALRLLAQGAVRVDGERVADRELRLAAGGAYVVQVGKRRCARVILA